MKKHLISSHKEEFSHIIKEYPNVNFYDVYKILKDNPRLFPFVNFKDISLTCDESIVLTKTEKKNTDIYIVKYLVNECERLVNTLNRSIDEFMIVNDIYKIIILYVSNRNSYNGLKGSRC
jgi:hypothetical protein